MEILKSSSKLVKVGLAYLSIKEGNALQAKNYLKGNVNFDDNLRYIDQDEVSYWINYFSFSRLMISIINFHTTNALFI